MILPNSPVDNFLMSFTFPYPLESGYPVDKTTHHLNNLGLM